jgi:hypothetical protein
MFSTFHPTLRKRTATNVPSNSHTNTISTARTTADVSIPGEKQRTGITTNYFASSEKYVTLTRKSNNTKIRRNEE